MRVAFIFGSFPALSETFILNQITGLIDEGHEVNLFVQERCRLSKIHSDIEKYELFRKTSFFNVPRNKILRLLKGLVLILKYFFVRPAAVFKTLNFFRYGKHAFSLRLFFWSLPFFNEEPFDIIHCHFGGNGVIGVLLRDLGILKGKVVTTFHGGDANIPCDGTGYRFLFKKGDLFTTNTAFTKMQIIKLGCPPERIRILPVGLEMKKFAFVKKTMPPDKIVNILTLGRLVEKKGHIYAIEAIKQVVRNNKNIRYIIAGDGELRLALEKKVRDLGLEAYVEFRGAIAQEEALRCYRDSQIFILPSVTAANLDREGQALVLQEAQACGLPVISTLHNGIPDGVLDGVSGFLVPEKDSKALAEKIEYLIGHAEAWEQMGIKGRNFVEKKYDMRILIKKLVDMYNCVLQN